MFLLLVASILLQRSVALVSCRRVLVFFVVFLEPSVAVFSQVLSSAF